MGCWVPVSERLPTDEGIYLVTTWNGELEILIYVWDTYLNEWKWKTYTHNRLTCGSLYVFAWMPLPEPWEGWKEERMRRKQLMRDANQRECCFGCAYYYPDEDWCMYGEHGIRGDLPANCEEELENETYIETKSIHDVTE